MRFSFSKAISLFLAIPFFAASGNAASSRCRGDVQKFCRGLMLGTEELEKCMLKNEKRLSKACQTERQQVRASLLSGSAIKTSEAATPAIGTPYSSQQPSANSCLEDVAKFCGDAPPDAGHIDSCLDSHQSKLSPACRQVHQK